MKSFYHQLSATVQEFPPNILPNVPMKAKSLAISPFYLTSLLYAKQGKCGVLSLDSNGSVCTKILADNADLDAQCLWRYIQVGWDAAMGVTLIQHISTGNFLCVPLGSTVPHCEPYEKYTTDRYNWVIQNRGLYFRGPEVKYLVYYNRMDSSGDASKYQAVKYGAMNAKEFEACTPSTCKFTCDTTGGYTCGPLSISYDRPIEGNAFIRASASGAVSMSNALRDDFQSPKSVQGAWGIGLWSVINDLENEWYPILIREDMGLCQAPASEPMGLGLLKCWKAGKNASDSLNRCTIPLQKRLVDSTSQTKPQQGQMPRIIFGFTTNGQERYVETKSNGFSENFDFWQYLDIFMYIGYNQGWPPIEFLKLKALKTFDSPGKTMYDIYEGFIGQSGSGTMAGVPKNIINTAHKNGCRFFSVLFFQLNRFGGKWKWWSHFLENRILYAEQIVDYAGHYGIDGFYINFEASTPGGNPHDLAGTDCSDYVSGTTNPCDHDECQGYWCAYALGGANNCDSACGTEGKWDNGGGKPTNNQGFDGSDINKKYFIEFLKHIRDYRKSKNIDVEICMYASMGPGGDSSTYTSGVTNYLLDFWRDPVTGEPVVDSMLSQPPNGNISASDIKYTYAHTSEAVKSCVEGTQGWPKNTGPMGTTTLSDTITCKNDPASTCGTNNNLDCDCGQDDCGDKTKCLSSANCCYDDSQPSDKAWCYKKSGSGNVICSGNDNTDCGPISTNDSNIPSGRAYDFWVGTDGEYGLNNYALNQDWSQPLWCSDFYKCDNNIQALLPPLSSFFLWSANLELSSLGTDDPTRTFKLNTDYYSQLYIGQTGLCFKNLTADPYVNSIKMGVCHFVAEKSVLSKIPFHTSFCLGNGENFYIDGSPQLYFGNWSDNIQDYLPTWRWWSRQMTQKDNNGQYLQSKILSLDYSRAFNGGSCLRIQSQNCGETDFHLFKTQWSLQDSLEMSVVYCGDPGLISLGYTLQSDGPLIQNPKIYYFMLKPCQAGCSTNWMYQKFHIPALTGAIINSICLRAGRTADGSNYNIFIGSLTVAAKGSSELSERSPNIPTICCFQQSASQLVNYNIAWNSLPNILHYNVFMNDLIVGRTYGTCGPVGPLDCDATTMYNVQNMPKNSTFVIEAVHTNGKRHKSLPSNYYTIILFYIFILIVIFLVVSLTFKNYFFSFLFIFIALALFFIGDLSSFIMPGKSGKEGIMQVPGNTGNLASPLVQIENWPQCKIKAFNINFDDNRPKAWTWLLDHVSKMDIPIKITFFINTLWLDRDKEKYLAWKKNYRVDYGVHGHWHFDHGNGTYVSPPNSQNWWCPGNLASCVTDEQLAANDSSCAQHVRDYLYDKDPVKEFVYAYPFGSYPKYTDENPSGHKSGDPKIKSLTAIKNNFLAARGVQWGQVSEFPDVTIPASLLGTCSNYQGQPGGESCAVSSCDLTKGKIYDDIVSQTVGPEYSWPGGIDLNLQQDSSNCTQLQMMEIRKNSLLTLLNSAESSSIMVWGHDFHPTDKNGIDWPCDNTFTVGGCANDNGSCDSSDADCIKRARDACTKNALELQNYSGNDAWSAKDKAYICPPDIRKEVDACATSCVRGKVDASGHCTDTDVFGKNGILAYNNPTMVYPIETAEGPLPCGNECFDSCWDPSVGSKLLEMLRSIKPFQNEIYFAFFVEIVQYLWNRKYSQVSYLESTASSLRYTLITTNVMRQIPLCISFQIQEPSKVTMDCVPLTVLQTTVLGTLKYYVEFLPKSNGKHILEVFY